jgi:DNA polymerase-3 subunit chi
MQTTKVQFYILPEHSEQADESQHALYHQVCLQAAFYYRANQRVFIFTQDQQQAMALDEMLWAFDPDSFVPHNLLGEGPRQGAAVELSWQAPTNRRAVLINLTPTVPNFANQFSQIIDFVPTDDTLKQQARDRFRTCRQWGFQVETQTMTPATN